MGRQSTAKADLMKAATDLVWTQNYGSVTIDAICERAGVKKGSFYYFFKSKADLVIQALEACWQEARPELDEIFSPSVRAVDRLMGMMDRSYRKTLEVKELYGRVLGCPFCTIGTEVSSVEPELLEKVREISTSYRRYMESALKEAQLDGDVEIEEPASAAQCLFTLYEGMLAQARIQNDPEIMRGLKDAAMRILGVKRTSQPNAA